MQERLKDSDDSHANTSNQLKKSRSVDAPFGDMRTLHETNIPYTQNSLPRAKSDFNLNSSGASSATIIGKLEENFKEKNHGIHKGVRKIG